MSKINILSPGFTTPNGAAFLFPLIINKRRLASDGIFISIFHKKTQAIYNCDFLFVDSKFHKFNWAKQTQQVIDEFHEFKDKVNRVFYFDTTDSSGSLQVEVLDIVDKYCKSLILKDKNLYKRRFYGNRIYSDYFYHNYGAADKENEEYSNSVDDIKLLDKLTVSWNSGLADYSLYGPYLMQLYNKLPVDVLLSYPKNFYSPSSLRNNDIHCRMGTNYSKISIAFQRKQIKELLEDKIPSDKLNRRKFFAELKNSKLTISPFGWGEITLKDFECFITGSLLLKPDMEHIETWPNFYIKDRTYIDFNWNINNLLELIDNTLKNYSSYLDIARQGQDNYKKYANCNDEGYNLFLNHLKGILV